MTAALPENDLERRVRDLEARLEEVRGYAERKASEAYRRRDQVHFRVWRDVASELHERLQASFGAAED